jgi:hypothetical protein
MTGYVLAEEISLRFRRLVVLCGGIEGLSRRFCCWNGERASNSIKVCLTAEAYKYSNL